MNDLLKYCNSLNLVYGGGVGLTVLLLLVANRVPATVRPEDSEAALLSL